MRELKFRAWDKDGKCWIPRDLCKLDFEGNLYTFDDTQENQDIYLKETIKYIIEQYTGLKDKNGKEIYEGDILYFIDGHPPIENKAYAYYEVIFILPNYRDILHPGFYCKSINKKTANKTLLLNYGRGAEVIGNIHENQELLNN